MKSHQNQIYNSNIKKYDECLYPMYEQDFCERRIRYPLLKLISMFLGISLLLTTIFPWYIYVATGLLGISICMQIVQHEYRKRSSKLFFIVLVMMGMVVLIDLGDGRLNWSIDYIIPLLLIGAITCIIIAMLIKHKGWEQYVGLQIYTVLIAVALNIMFMINISQTPWPSIVALVWGIGTLALMAMIFGRDYTLVLEKFLHV
ncbi:DUF6320 domain-containing protein [Vallitalea okinawensis]|uniref:DUF6320 domain-containing protein n=1 Tax=Vallitalea okinawensis TaxID=2078660 RepID=UPI000CFE0B94|nr:DUF6320 domain-containing protein [Vallitalea okinawensis]